MIKVLCTLGPSSLNEPVVRALSALGVNLLRINLSHVDLENLSKIIADIQSWTSIPICLDSEGAQIRNETMSGGAAQFNEGDFITIHYESIIGDSRNLSLTPKSIFEQLKVGDEIQIDFNGATFSVIKGNKTNITAKVLNAGMVGSNKGAVVNRSLELSPVTRKDKAAFELGLEMGVEHYALSFTHRPSDVSAIREIIGNMNLTSKIESIEGVSNIREILPMVDQILIDRGDLSREIPIEKIPFIQRSLISYARMYETPVYVATNLLESMIVSGTPTRAEANDVASTLIMGASGLVLAAETAIGAHPIDSVKMAYSIIRQFQNWSPEITFKDLIHFK